MGKTRNNLKKQQRRNKMKKGQAPEPKTVGTAISEKERAKANDYSDAKRQGLLEKGLAMIYGNGGYAKCEINRR
jgi:hypothetical protein